MFIFKTFFFQNATYKQGKKDPVALHFYRDTKSLNRLEDFGENKISKPESVTFFGIAV